MLDFVRRVPEGDNRERSMCAGCGRIAYDNPNVGVGSVVVADDFVLMCRRAVDPRGTERRMAPAVGIDR